MFPQASEIRVFRYFISYFFWNRVPPFEHTFVAAIWNIFSVTKRFFCSFFEPHRQRIFCTVFIRQIDRTTLGDELACLCCAFFPQHFFATPWSINVDRISFFSLQPIDLFLQASNLRALRFDFTVELVISSKFNSSKVGLFLSWSDPALQRISLTYASLGESISNFSASWEIFNLSLKFWILFPPNIPKLVIIALRDCFLFYLS